MQLFYHRPTLTQLHWLIWVFVFFVIALSLLQMNSAAQAFVYALLNTIFYAAIVYGNITFLYPRLYKKGHILFYIIAVITFLTGIAAIRSMISLGTYNLWFAKHADQLSLKMFYSSVFGSLMVFLLSFVFRMAIAYFKLKQQSEEIIRQRTQTELDLLKSQVQPHFLFNTLNNIYYEAYLEAPRTASLIERLSDIMRYFVDESPKQLVSLATEIQFLENYIALEKIRIRYEVAINFTKYADSKILIPPMLLMTFVENIFKHGIDKTSMVNRIEISIVLENQWLSFSTMNTLPYEPVAKTSSGFGIANLRKRLELLYGNNFHMQTSNDGEFFKASLNIPLA